MISSVKKKYRETEARLEFSGRKQPFYRDGQIRLRGKITADKAEIINTIREIDTLKEEAVESKNLEITEPYVKPEMDVIKISNEYALITAGCGSCTVFEPDENEAPFMGDF